MPFRLYLCVHWRGFPESPYLALSTHALQMPQVLLLSVSNSGYFICRVVFFSGCIWGFVGEIFLKVHNQHFPYMHYENLLATGHN